MAVSRLYQLFTVFDPIRVRLDFLRTRRRLEKLKDIDVIVVVGMKRSGHHAIISWIMNGLVGREVTMVTEVGSGDSVRTAIPTGTLALPQYSRSTDGLIVHINDAPARWKTQENSFARWSPPDRMLSNCRYLIISYEDVAIGDAFPEWMLHRRPGRRIYVQRNLANNVASRVQGNISWAKRGKRTIFHVDDQYFATIESNLRLPNAEWEVVDFDRWSSHDHAYRSELMERFGLGADVDPQRSHFGGGSSFSGTSGDDAPEGVANRWQTFSWDEGLVERMLTSRAASLLTSEQVDFFTELLAKSNSSQPWAPTITNGYVFNHPKGSHDRRVHPAWAMDRT